jgi:hypothetical protein
MCDIVLDGELVQGAPGTWLDTSAPPILKFTVVRSGNSISNLCPSAALPCHS